MACSSSRAAASPTTTRKDRRLGVTLGRFNVLVWPRRFRVVMLDGSSTASSATSHLFFFSNDVTNSYLALSKDRLYECARLAESLRGVPKWATVSSSVEDVRGPV
jgi:hypothetical protein